MHFLRNSIVSIFTVIPLLVSAQIYTITGNVRDFISGIPVPGAMVFINNTTKGCLTDDTGNFSLSGVKEKYFDLIVAGAGHERSVYRFTPEQRNKRILFEVARSADTISAKTEKKYETDLRRWGDVFLDVFLGGSVNAEECNIVNPQVLRFRYDSLNKVLLVNSAEPLQIFNESLGYKIICQVDELGITARHEILTSTVYTWFKESVTRRKEITEKWKINRVNAYEGSLLHFMQAFYAGKVLQEGFVVKTITRIYENENETAYQNALNVSGNIGGREVNRLPGEKYNNIRSYVDVISKKGLDIEKIRVVDTAGQAIFFSSSQPLQVGYRQLVHRRSYNNEGVSNGYIGPVVSYIQLHHNNNIRVENNGMYFEPSDVTVAGYWGELGMADQLPCDYILPEN
jgi:hypothetical protein